VTRRAEYDGCESSRCISACIACRLETIIAKPLTLLVVGDIVGSPGRDAVARYLPLTREQYGVDCCIANGENAAGGFGLTESTAKELFNCGVDVITSGNHIYDKREFRPYLDASTRVLRPANYPPAAPGRGTTIIDVDGVRVGVLNLMGRVFMPAVDDPFAVGRLAVDELRSQTPIIVVDVHAEASSEKMALARFFDGEISLLFGTHTHVQTADEQIFPNGTAYMTDVGMTGPTDGVIGMETAAVLDRFTTSLSERFSVVKEGANQFGALLVEVDRDSGKAQSVKRISIRGRC
jgi:metallophosphoesterase (TIGR00282 family)